MQSTITDESSRTAANQISVINEALAEKVGQKKFRIWFKNSTKMTLADGYLKVGVPNLFIASWIENHFLDEITQVVRAVIGAEVKITFSIDPELSGHQRRTQLGSQMSAVATVEKARRSSLVAHRTGHGARGTRHESRKRPRRWVKRLVKSKKYSTKLTRR